MKKGLILIISLLFLLSCKNKFNDDKSMEKDYLFSSPLGNTLEIYVPEYDIYTYDQTEIIIKTKYHKKFTPVIPEWDELEESMNLVYVRESQKMIPAEDEIVREFKLLIDHLLPGDYLFKPILIEFSEEGVVVDQIETEYIPLSVKSSLIDESGDLIDNFQPIDMKKNIYIYIIITVLILLFISSFIYRIVKYMKKKNKIENMEPILYKNLILELSSDNLKIYYANLNNLLKQFMENELHLTTISQTTEEFIKNTEFSIILEEWLKIQLYDFMKRSDSVSFGLLTPDKTQIEGDSKFCCDFIDYINNRIVRENDNGI